MGTDKSKLRITIVPKCSKCGEAMVQVKETEIDSDEKEVMYSCPECGNVLLNRELVNG